MKDERIENRKASQDERGIVGDEEPRKGLWSCIPFATGELPQAIVCGDAICPKHLALWRTGLRTNGFSADFIVLRIKIPL